MQFKQKNQIRLIAILSLVMFLPYITKSQVTVGDKTAPQSFSLLEISTAIQKGGLRLPQLTTAERNAFDLSSNFKEAKGLVIYNTDNNCIEYWNNLRWVSLCTGNAYFILRDNDGNIVDPTIDPNGRFPAEGATKGPWTPESMPPCIASVPYDISVVAGGEYTQVTVSEPSTGRFTITMDKNPTAFERTAIIRITDNCTNEYKDFLFIQDANTNLCQSGVAKPNIVVDPSNMTACSGGAVYMSVSNPSPTATYIWTFNNVEIARGTWWYADKTGTYRVYVGAIGCMSNASDEINISISEVNAPTPAPKITAENNGIICSGIEGITLIASNYGADASKVTWFKDGVKQGTGATMYVSSANATAAGNDWIAVIADGSCYSLPSNIVRVKTNSSTGLTIPDVTINNLDIHTVTYCKGGVLNITINNMNAYAGKTVDFIFKNGNDVLNVTKIDDSHYQYIVPPATSGMLFSVTVQESSGTFCNNSVSSKPVELIYSAPSKPTVTSPGTNFLICGTTPAVVASSVTGTRYTYTWYKDGVIDATKTTSSFTTTQPGKYAVVVTTAEGCITERSDEVEVKQSGNPAQAAISGAPTVNKLDVETYTVAQEAGVTYQWLEGTNGVTLVSPSLGTSASYRFEQDGVTAQVKVQASNACGTIIITKDVTVTADCTPPSITGGTAMVNPVIDLIEGQTLTLSVNTMGTAPTFQWYKDGNPIPGATSATYMKNNVTISDGGIYMVVATGSGNCSSQMAVGGNITVTVNKNPASYPVGLGKFEGKTCFDVVETNSGGDCGTLTSRLPQKANFAQEATYKQTYSFTSKGSYISKIRFYAVDQTGLVIDSIVPGNPTWATGTNLYGTYTVTVYYKTNLNTTAAGKDRANALIAMLYVVYNDQGLGGGTDKRLELKLSIQDCTCCPGYLAVGKEYVQKNPGATVTGFAVGSTFDKVIAGGDFIATNKDVCFYKFDNGGGSVMGYTSATTVCDNGSAADGATGWRLPTIAELGAIQNVSGNLSGQATSIAGTQNMVNDKIAAGEGAAYYWSSSQWEVSTTTAWGWNFHPQIYRAQHIQGTSQNVRCVRTQ